MKFQFALIVFGGVGVSAGNVPSDIPSMVPSDFPSITPSSAPTKATVPTVIAPVPTSIPSDYPSVVPSRWTDTEYALPEGFSVCGRSEDMDFDLLQRLTVAFLYEVNVEPGFDVDEVRGRLNSMTYEELMDIHCHDGSNRHRNLARAHAMSTELSGMPVDQCGDNCFMMLGRVTLLIDSHESEDYQRLYCDTFKTVRDIVDEDTMTTVQGAATATFLRDTPSLSSQFCDDDEYVDNSARSRSATGVQEQVNNEGNRSEAIPIWTFAVGVASAILVVLGFVACHTRRAQRSNSFYMTDGNPRFAGWEA